MKEQLIEFKDVYNIDIEISSYSQNGKKVYSQEVYYGDFIRTATNEIRKTARKNSVYVTYNKFEEALEIGLQEALNLIK